MRENESERERKMLRLHKWGTQRGGRLRKIDMDTMRIGVEKEKGWLIGEKRENETKDKNGSDKKDTVHHKRER